MDIIGFPTKWWARQLLKPTETRRLAQNKLIVILRCGNKSIHDVINDPKIREIIRICYKDMIWYERKQKESAEKQNADWLAWCKNAK